jgi:arsenate reductase
MEEAFVNSLYNEFEAESAGLEPGGLNPFVIKVMQEIGIDISKNSTDSVTDFYNEGKKYDLVIAVCDKNAAESCPIFPGAGRVLHWPFEDPSSFKGNDEEKLNFTRKIRDEIKEKIVYNFKS